jgi:hypothetical protein
MSKNWHPLILKHTSQCLRSLPSVSGSDYMPLEKPSAMGEGGYVQRPASRVSFRIAPALNVYNILRAFHLELEFM